MVAASVALETLVNMTAESDRPFKQLVHAQLNSITERLRTLLCSASHRGGHDSVALLGFYRHLQIKTQGCYRQQPPPKHTQHTEHKQQAAELKLTRLGPAVTYNAFELLAKIDSQSMYKNCFARHHRHHYHHGNSAPTLFG